MEAQQEPQKPQHTPTPWAHGSGYEQSERGTYIYSKDPHSGLIVAAEQDGTDCVLRPEDAEFIVRACNAHDALVAQLGKAMGIIKGEYPKVQWDEFYGVSDMQAALDLAKEA
jgi:hypothetical protein